MEIDENIPNFITSKSVSGNVIRETKNKKTFEGNILFIASADPGYDWIFSHNIGGFVTMYGGVNSHMSIRAGELDIPAIIGCGELLFKKWSQAKFIEINCANKSVKIVK